MKTIQWIFGTIGIILLIGFFVWEITLCAPLMLKPASEVPAICLMK